MSKQGDKEKFYTVSARLVFSGIIVVLLVGLIIGASILINKGPVVPLLGIFGTVTSNQLVINAGCVLGLSYDCQNPMFNATSGILTVALTQRTGYNWTAVTVRFVPVGTAYSNGVPELSWSPPNAVNVTGGMLSNMTKYVNIPITSGHVSAGMDITGSIWAKYQFEVGGSVSYANISSAYVTVR